MPEYRAVIFDLETVPDIAAAKIALGLAPSSTDREVRSKLSDAYRRDGQPPEQAFIKSVLHRIVCIGALYASRTDRESPWSIIRSGTVHIGQRNEREIVSAFIESLADAPAPQLVGFNSSGFDLPVLRYRAIALGVPAPILHKANGRDYWYRYGKDHLDLCDFVSGFGATTRPSLSELGSLLGLVVKAGGMDGSEVESLVNNGRSEEVANYCESDVLATYLIFLRLSLVTGELQLTSYQKSLDDMVTFLSQRMERRPHLARFVEYLSSRQLEQL